MPHKHFFRRYLLAGIVFWVPVLVTLAVLRFLVGIVDNIFNLLPANYQPSEILGIHIPGLGIVFALVIIFATGMLVTNIIGNRLVAVGESVVSRIPLVRTIYHAVKQVLSTLLSSQEDSFRNVLLVEYPRKGMWSIAFQTSVGFQMAEQMTNKSLITIFIPTTPNPTSGFLMLVPKEDTIKLDLSVDQALKMVISLGVVLPDVIDPKDAVLKPTEENKNA